MKTGLFPYSGSKARVLNRLRPPPTRIVAEPFGGSLAYSMNHEVDAIYAADTPEIINIYLAASTMMPWEFIDWQRRLEDTPLIHGEDIRGRDFPPWLEYLLRLSVCGVYVGQTTSYQVYGQYAHRAPVAVERLASFASQARKLVGLRTDFRLLDHLHTNHEVTWFIDPPYLGTFGNYRRQTPTTVEEISSFVEACHGPVCFTYGGDAPDVFPQFAWEMLQERKVPKIRTGGVGIRREYVTYLNWG